MPRIAKPFPLILSNHFKPLQKQSIAGRIRTTTDLNDLAECDLIEESIPENLESKKDLFAKLDLICKPETIFGTNTSGLSVTDMAAARKIDVPAASRERAVPGKGVSALATHLLGVVLPLCAPGTSCGSCELAACAVP